MTQALNDVIYETVVTTRCTDGRVHAAPMGVRYRGAQVVLMPFRPSTTLDNLLLDRRAALAQASFQLQSAIAQIDAFVEQAGEYARRHPDAAPRWLERARRAEQMRAQKKHALRTAAESVAAFEQEVERARTEWALVEAERALSSALGATHGDPMDQLLERTALDSVRLEMNRAFASLETELVLDLQAVPPSQPHAALADQGDRA